MSDESFASLSLAERIDIVCDRFEQEWLAGKSPAIETFLDSARPEDRHELWRALALVELELLVRAGAKPDAKNWQTRFPEHAGRVGLLFEEAAELVTRRMRERVSSGQTSRSSAVDADTSINPAVSTAPPARPLETLGRFKILGTLGQGAFGTVYRARDPHLDREVALKVPRLDVLSTPQDRERFLREARAAAGLSHPNICPVHEVGVADGCDYIVMSYIEGKPLSKIIQAGRVQAKQAANAIRKLALALDEAHAKGIIHRDLKPANIMINSRGEPVVMDFGLARLQKPGDAQITQSGMIMGSPAYMSPEQARGATDEIGPVTDVYSLGVVLYELLTGKRPFEGTVTEVLGQILHVDPPPPSTLRAKLDPRLEKICLKAMAKRPEERYKSMRDLAAALSDYIRTVDGPPAAPGPGRKKSAGIEALLPEGHTLSARIENQRKPESTRGIASMFARVSAGIQTQAKEHQRRHKHLVIALGIGFAALAFLFSGLWFFARNDTVTVVINIPIDTGDPALSFFLDGKQIASEALGAPIELKPGEHQLVVNRNDRLFKKFRFSVGKEDHEPVVVQDVTDPVPIAHWTFDDPANLGRDSAADPAHARMVRKIDVAPGIHGFAADLSAGGYFRVAAVPKLDLRKRLTLAAWTKWTGADSPGVKIAGRNDQNKGHWELWARREHAGGAITFPTGTTPGADVGFLTKLEPGTWNHLAITFDGSAVAWYVNGRLVQTDPLAESANIQKSLAVSGQTEVPREIMPLKAPLIMGSPDTNRPLNGLIDDVRIYDVSLTEQQIAELARRPEIVEERQNVAVLPGGPPGAPFKWMSYSVHDPKVLPEIADHVNLVHDRSWQESGDALVRQARKRGLPLIPTFHRSEFPAIKERLFEFVRKNRDVVAGVCLASSDTASEGFTAEQVGEFGRELKQEFPGISFWMACITMPAGIRNPMPEVPPEVDVIEVTSYFDMSPQSLEATVNQHLPGWLQRAKGRPVVLRWVSKPAGWTPASGPLKAAAGTFRKCAELAEKYKLSGLVFDQYGPRGDNWSPGIDTQPAAVDEIRGIARQYGFLQAAIGDVQPESPLDRLNAADIPPRERFAWQPKELVAVFGEHRASHWGKVNSLDVNPDGRLIASAGDDATIQLCDAATLELKGTLDGHEGAVHWIEFLKNGEELISSGADGTLRLWDVKSRREVRKFIGHAGAVLTVAVTPEGTRALSGGEDATIRLWDLATGQELRQFNKATKAVWKLIIAADGRRVLSGGDDRTMRFWSLESGEDLVQFNIEKPGTCEFRAIALSPDGSRAVSGRSEVRGMFSAMRLWDTATGQELRRVKGIKNDGHGVEILVPGSMTFSPDGSQILTGCHSPADGNVLILWDARSCEPIRRFEKQATFASAVAFSPDGRQAYTGTRYGRLRAWDIATGKDLVPWTGHESFLASVALAPDSLSLLTGGEDLTVRLWETAGLPTERQLFRAAEPGTAYSPPWRVAFAPDGKQAVLFGGTYAYDRALLWNVPEWKIVSDLRKELDLPVYAAAFSPDGQQLLLGLDQGLLLWKQTLSDERPQLAGPEVRTTMVAFVNTERAVSTGYDHIVRLWDLTERRELKKVGPFSGETSVAASATHIAVSSLGEASVWLHNTALERPQLLSTGVGPAMAFSPDGATLATANREGRIVLWSSDTGKSIRELKLPGAVYSLAFDATGRYLVTGNANGTAYLLRLRDSD